MHLPQPDCGFCRPVRLEKEHIVRKGMKMTLIGVAFVGASLLVWGAAGCGKRDASCEAVFEHVRELAPADMREMIDATKDGSIAKCEKLSVEQRKCILEASDLGQVSACKKK